jgi:hypothetical protein
MMELSATSILSLFDSTKEQRKTFASSVLARINAGDVNPLNVHIQVKCLEDILKGLLANDEYRELVLAEMKKYGNKTFEYGNAEVSVKETGVKYNYAMCNDPIYADLQRQQLELKAQMEDREKFLKTLPGKGMDVLLEGGELVTMYPPSKSSTTSPVVKLK